MLPGMAADFRHISAEPKTQDSRLLARYSLAHAQDSVEALECSQCAATFLKRFKRLVRAKV